MIGEGTKLILLITCTYEAEHFLQMTYIRISDVYSRYSFRKRKFEHLLRLTDSFSWEELPTRDPEKRYLTKAGYIPLIASITKYVMALLLAFHAIQCTVRIVLYHDMMFTAWYPFDVSGSPAYEIANFTQVMLKHL
jgi:hypothetical protein